MKKIIVVFGLLYPLFASAIDYEITTGSKTGTYYQIGKNLEKYVAPEAGINLSVLTSNGSLDNTFKLYSYKNPNLKFAIVQNDVLQELKKFASEGNQKAINLVDKLRVLAPLYDEEIHIISKKNSGISTFGDLRGKRISIGKKKSGTAMTSQLLYKEMFGEQLHNFTTQSFDQALLSLERDTVDAIIKVAGQPVVRLSKKMSKDAAKFLQLLSYNENTNTHQNVSSYYPSSIRYDSYPWIDHDIPTLTTKAFLITYDYTKQNTRQYLKKFMKSFKKNLPIMQRNATKDIYTPHLKWNEVSSDCMPELPGGWKYHSVVEEICLGSSSFQPECSEYKRTMGLCN